ncbi:MAG: hypothetical protein QUV06_06315 [Cyanobium sp. CZS 48M]|nr:hypothetical protein [Cyanobium sp. CZS48M]
MAGPTEPQDTGPQLHRPADRQLQPAGVFQRERFLLRLVALILIGEVLLFALGAATCIVQSRRSPLPQGSLCHRVDSSLEAAFAVALNTLLALLGGKAVGDNTR